MPVSKYRVQKSRSTRPYLELRYAAKFGLETAKTKRDGWGYDKLTTILFSALAVEAFCNSLGDELFENWQDFDRLNIIGKTRLIAEKLEVEHDKAIEPWSTVVWLTGFRNKLVHSRPEKLAVDTVVDEKTMKKLEHAPPQSKIERENSLPNAIRACESTDKLYELLLGALPKEKRFSFVCESWNGSITLLPEEKAADPASTL